MSVIDRDRTETERLDLDDLDDAPRDDDVADEAHDDADERPPIAELLRPLLATSLAASGSALVVGGIFGSWSARIIGLVAVLAGSAWAGVTRRSRSPGVTQFGIVLVLLLLGVLSLVGTAGGGPSELPRLVGDAIESGRLFRPPVPFDPGWRPLLVALLGSLAYAAGAIAVGRGQPKLGVGVCVPLTVLAMVSQPDDAAFLGGVLAFLPTIAALSVLFGDDGERASELTREFETKRAVRGVAGAFVIVGLLFGLNSASFLFPDPVYDPDDQPQKPRSVPLSASRDRVLFTVASEDPFTGPWRVGALDIYRDDAFQSVPSNSRLVDLPADGALSDLRTGRTPVEVQIAIADLGDSSVLPMVAGTTQVTLHGDVAVRFDPRTETIRVPQGRVPTGLEYTLAFPPYATDEELEAATAGGGPGFAEQLEAPSPPPHVSDLLAGAPDNRWERLDLLRQTLLDRVIASGAGAPTDVPVDRVDEIMAPPGPDAEEGDGNEATPFEIVATEALLARWAEVPSRIGFGFDGLNTEDGVKTVRPRNSAQWLEVHFEDFGWVPLIGQPDQAKASLDNDPNARNDPDVVASRDVAARVYLVYESRDIRLLYQRVRDELLFWAPGVAVALLAWLCYPAAAKARRARRRRAHAAGLGPLAQIAVEYAEFRDTCIDLGVGDDYDTPLEYYFKVEPDREHEELAWLVTRTLYGDLGHRVGPDDAHTATDLSGSLRRRVLRAQPLQSRLLAAISRASIEVPYSTELPNVRVVRLWPLLRRGLARVSGPPVRAGATATHVVRRGLRAALDVPRRAIARRLPDVFQEAGP